MACTYVDSRIGQRPEIQRISHWRGQEAQTFDAKVPSLLHYTAPLQESAIPPPGKLTPKFRLLGNI